MQSFIAPEVGVEPTFACEHRRMSRVRDELSKLGICFFDREVPHHVAFPAKAPNEQKPNAKGERLFPRGSCAFGMTPNAQNAKIF
jgi:hypothetical protein